MSVIPFTPKCKPVENDGPHLTGECICGACHHEWVGVMPVGTGIIDCPNCGRGWGAMKHQVVPKFAWKCNCGEMQFWLTPEGAMCRRCGIITTDWAN